MAGVSSSAGGFAASYSFVACLVTGNAGDVYNMANQLLFNLPLLMN